MSTDSFTLMGVCPKLDSSKSKNGFKLNLDIGDDSDKKDENITKNNLSKENSENIKNEEEKKDENSNNIKTLNEDENDSNIKFI